MPTVIGEKGHVRSCAIRLIRDLPKRSSWDDLMYRIYLRRKIEAGLADLRAGRVYSHEAICRELGVA